MAQKLSKQQAIQISEFCSSIYQQGSTWVFKELDLDTGLTKLTRGLTGKAALKKIQSWRKEKVEELLRGDGQMDAFLLRSWHENPNWNGEGIWQWEHNFWFTTKEEAEEVLARKASKLSVPCEVYQIKTAALPGHFAVYC